jgi:hypothetical protein
MRNREERPVCFPDYIREGLARLPGRLRGHNLTAQKIARATDMQQAMTNAKAQPQIELLMISVTAKIVAATASTASV